MTQGRFISFEGIDGAGKSTHIGAIAERVRARGCAVVTTREPGGSELAEAIRTLVLQQPMDALTETLLVFAARRDHLITLIEPALAAGKTVLCDRFTDASFAYQGSGRGLDGRMLHALESWVQEGRQPDLTLWFDVDARIAAERRTAARQPDRFERLDIGFFQRVRAGYLARADAAPDRIVRIDAALSPTAVLAQLIDALEARGW